jgi:hypothetical protein
VPVDHFFFLLELHTNCSILYGTTLKILFLGQSGTELYHTGLKPVCIKYIIIIKVKIINLWACIMVMQIPSFTTQLLAC